MYVHVTKNAQVKMDVYVYRNHILSFMSQISSAQYAALPFAFSVCPAIYLGTASEVQSIGTDLSEVEPAEPEAVAEGPVAAMAGEDVVAVAGHTLEKMLTKSDLCTVTVQDLQCGHARVAIWKLNPYAESELYRRRVQTGLRASLARSQRAKEADAAQQRSDDLLRESRRGGLDEELRTLSPEKAEIVKEAIETRETEIKAGADGDKKGEIFTLGCWRCNRCHNVVL